MQLTSTVTETGFCFRADSDMFRDLAGQPDNRETHREVNRRLIAHNGGSDKLMSSVFFNKRGGFQGAGYILGSRMIGSAMLNKFIAHVN